MQKPTKHTFLACLLPVIHISVEGAIATGISKSTETFTREGIFSLTIPLLGAMVLSLIAVILLLTGGTDGRRVFYGMVLNFSVSWVIIGIGLLMNGRTKAAVMITVPVLALLFLLAVNLQYGHNRKEQFVPILSSPLWIWLAWVIASAVSGSTWFLK